MAASGMGKFKKSKIKILDIDLDGIFQTQTRSQIVVDIIKFIISQRQLIPISYQQLERDLDPKIKKEKTVSSESRSSRLLKAEKELKKKHNVLKALYEIFDAVESVFVYGGPVQEVIFSVGATIVSPKEIYSLQFPTSFHEGNTLSFKQCSSLLFRKLVSSDFLGDCSYLKPGAKLSVLIRAPRNCEIASKKLVPRMAYKEPARCSKFVVNFKCRVPEASAELSRMGDFDGDISGIEPLELSHIRTPGHELHTLPSLQIANDRSHRKNEELASPQLNLVKKYQDICQQPGTPMDINNQSVAITVSAPTDVTHDCEGTEDDLIWYQVPITMTGYVDKVTKKASSDSMFMV